MAHLKRQSTPKNWPIPRKGSRFVVRPLQGLHKGFPILIALRDILKLAQNRKEVKIALNSKKIELNAKPVKDDKKVIFLFDVLKIAPSEEYYRLELNDKGKFTLVKIDKKEADKKICKIIGKKILKGKKIQLNFENGSNIIVDKNYKVNDSLVINLKTKKIEKLIELKEGSKAFISSGKYAGQKGIIEKINKTTKIAEIKINNHKIHAPIKKIIAIE